MTVGIFGNEGHRKQCASRFGKHLSMQAGIRYTEGSSERYISGFIMIDRDYFVPATHRDDPNRKGNRKNKVQSLKASLKRLQTD